MNWVGEGAAISAAIVWAVATWIYGQFSHHFSALQLNIVKGVIGSAMMLLVMPFLSQMTFELSSKHAMILAVSGVVGIAIGDSAYFAALKRIGPNNTLLLESLAPPLSGLIALMFLGISMGIMSWIGIFVTTAAVTMVILQPADRSQAVSMSGIGFGLLASVCQATGVVISHFALVAGDIDPLIGAVLRLSIGVLAVALFVPWVEAKPFSKIWHNGKAMPRSDKGYLLLAIMVGTFIALWLQQIALKHANPAIAQTLIATSPLFMLVIYWIKGQKISSRSILGTLAAIVGIALLLLS